MPGGEAGRDRAAHSPFSQARPDHVRGGGEIKVRTGLGKLPHYYPLHPVQGAGELELPQHALSGIDGLTHILYEENRILARGGSKHVPGGTRKMREHSQVAPGTTPAQKPAAQAPAATNQPAEAPAAK